MTLTPPVESCCQGEDWCAVTCAADLIARKWHPTVLHRLMRRGPLGFSEIHARIGGISGKMLSESLTDLESKGLVGREVVSERPFRVRYALTEAGAALEPVIAAMEDWGRRYLRPGRVRSSDLAAVRVEK